MIRGVFHRESDIVILVLGVSGSIGRAIIRALSFSVASFVGAVCNNRSVSAMYKPLIRVFQTLGSGSSSSTPHVVAGVCRTQSSLPTLEPHDQSRFALVRLSLDRVILIADFFNSITCAGLGGSLYVVKDAPGNILAEFDLFD